jgi:3-deoxy-7-phosphoheptulonate synthase
LPLNNSKSALSSVVASLGNLPPLVTPWEIDALKSELARVARGEAFLLQCGDCAESFDDCTEESIVGKLKCLLQMSVVLVHGTRTPVVRVGRMAGQYAKPRSADTETRDGVTLPSYRGDNVNRIEFEPLARTPDPNLLMRGYERAALTLNLVRALTARGFADLHHPELWDLSFAQHSEHHDTYQGIIQSIRESISFMEAIAGRSLTQLGSVDLYASHEALALHYEAAQTRRAFGQPGFYNLSTHLPWIGMRTADPNGAHVEYCRGIKNPIGIKVGPSISAEWLTRLIDVLHPDNEPGRLVLIHRLGADRVAELLPAMVETVKKTGRDVVWCCDPMHGNTETTDDGLKTRRFDRILLELERSFATHQQVGSRLSGVHFELTGDDVTECLGGARQLEAADLHRMYLTRVDPRLNAEQGLEMALRIADHLRHRPVP